MALDEAKLRQLEEAFPTHAEEAFAKAYAQALAAGLSVVAAYDGVIYEIFPDGTRRVLKHIEPNLPVQAGTRVELR